MIPTPQMAAHKLQVFDRDEDMTDEMVKKVATKTKCLKQDGLFRSYDVRGVYGQGLDEAKAERIGRAFGRYIGSGSLIGVAMDIRYSSEPLKNNLIKGMGAEGCKVVDLGIMPTPLLYFSTKSMKLDGGVMVTASHLPPEWNGFKFCDGNGRLIFGETGLKEVERIYYQNKMHGNKTGSASKYGKVIADYVRYVAPMIGLGRRMKVVVDYGNSVTSLVVPELFGKLDIERIDLNDKLEGAKPNRASEMSRDSLRDLSSAVVRNKADMGIAYDGDGDRLAFVDEKGNAISNGSVLIQIFSKYYLGLHKNRAVVYDVTCSFAVPDYVNELGGNPIASRVGFGYCTQAALKSNAIMCGEYSGHIGLPEMDLRDDAIFNSLRLLQIVSSSKTTVSGLVGGMPKYSASKGKEVACSDALKFKIVETVEGLAKDRKLRFDDIDGVKVLEDDGWVLIRASNTSPIIRVIAEGKTAEKAAEMQSMGEILVDQAVTLN